MPRLACRAEFSSSGHLPRLACRPGFPVFRPAWTCLVLVFLAGAARDGIIATRAVPAPVSREARGYRAWEEARAGRNCQACGSCWPPRPYPPHPAQGFAAAGYVARSAVVVDGHVTFDVEGAALTVAGGVGGSVRLGGRCFAVDMPASFLSSMIGANVVTADASAF